MLALVSQVRSESLEYMTALQKPFDRLEGVLKGGHVLQFFGSHSRVKMIALGT